MNDEHSKILHLHIILIKLTCNDIFPAKNRKAQHILYLLLFELKLWKKKTNSEMTLGCKIKIFTNKSTWFSVLSAFVI